MLAYTQLKDTNRKSLRDIIPLKKPFTLIVEPSALCNFRCVMCFQSTCESGYFFDSKQNMSLDTFRLIIKQLYEWEGDKIKVLKLSLYGEPLINPHFCEMLKIARDAGIAERIETTSNISMLTPEISEGLINGGLDYLRVSIYSPIQDKHEKITGTAIKIEKIREDLKNLQKLKKTRNTEKPFVAIKMLDNYNADNDLFLDMYKDVADEIYFDKPHNWVAATKNYIGSLYGEKSGHVISDLQNQDNQCKSCGISFYTLAVRCNGDTAPCCVDWNGGTNIGNIHETALKDIWLGEGMRRFWMMQLQGKNNKNESCRTCRIYKSGHYSKDNVDGVPVEKLGYKNNEHA
jgi:MoaA/NifB/PqqE/SkfB family radical SAM enzyme